MSKTINIVNQRFGRLVVIQRGGISKNGKALWLCICDCGQKKIIVSGDLRYGKTQSCGCLQRELTISRSTKHGHSPKGQWSQVYRAWKNIIQRCINPNNKNYKDYGGRGITICERWRNSFPNFLEDMGEPLTKNHSIDRINNDKGYYKENCRWATKTQQNRNSRRNRLISYKGKTQCIATWADEIKVIYSTLLYRFNRGWSTQRALTTPIKI